MKYSLVKIRSAGVKAGYELKKTGGINSRQNHVLGEKYQQWINYTFLYILTNIYTLCILWGPWKTCFQVINARVDKTDCLLKLLLLNQLQQIKQRKNAEWKLHATLARHRPRQRLARGAVPGSKLFITRRCPGVAAKNLTELANIKGSEIDKIALPLMLIRRKYLGLILNHWL